MRVGVTGHRAFEPAVASGGAQVVGELVRTLPDQATPLVGVTSLAAGADQIFADAVLAAGGAIEAVIPFAGYERELLEPAARAGYERLLARARDVRVLPASASKEQ